MIGISIEEQKEHIISLTSDIGSASAWRIAIIVLCIAIWLFVGLDFYGVFGSDSTLKKELTIPFVICLGLFLILNLAWIKEKQKKLNRLYLFHIRELRRRLLIMSRYEEFESFNEYINEQLN